MLRKKGPLIVWVLTLLFLLSSVGIAGAAPADQAQQTGATPFTDVSSTDKNALYIGYMAKRGLITGFPDGTYHPGEGLTRAQAAVLFSKIRGLNPTEKDSTLSDVAGSHWAAGYIAAAVKAGYITGFPDSTYRPQAILTRAQGINLFLQLATEKDSSEEIPVLQDLDKNHWAANSLAIALAAGMIEAQGNNIKPEQPFARGDLARALSILLTKDPGLNQQELIGKLKVKKGTVEIKRAGSEKTQTINTASIVRKGDTVITGRDGETEINYPDGSGILLKPDSELIIKTSVGRAYILKDGRPGTAVEDLQVELTNGKLFGALASKYTGKEETAEEAEETASNNKYNKIASRDKNFDLMAAKSSAQPWYKTAEKKKVKVKVDMPWGVAAIRGSFWSNYTSNSGSGMSLLQGDGSLSSGGQTQNLSPGQSSGSGSSGGPPSLPGPMSPSEAREWAQQRGWVGERAGEMQSNQGAGDPGSEGQGEGEGEGEGDDPGGEPPDNLMDNLNNALDQAAQTAASGSSGSSGGGSSGGSSGGTVTTQVTVPTANPPAGTYNGAVNVTLTCATDGATVYYTTDGSDPRSSSTRMVYSTPINISSTAAIMSYAVKTGMTDSQVVSFSYTITITTAGSQSAPSLAYNEEYQNYLIVYEKHDGNNSTIYGKIWPTDGTTQGNEFSISGSGVNREPAVVLDPNTMNYLVLWSDQGNTPAIRGQLVNSSGDLQGNSFTVYANGSRPQLKPNIECAYSSLIAVWQDGDGLSDRNIMGCYISVDNNTPNVQTPFNLNQVAGSYYDPAVAYNNNYAECLVVFNDGDDLRGILIGEGYISDPLSIASGNGIQGSGAVIPIYDYNSEYRFLVAWQDQRQGNYDIMARFASPTFVNDEPTLVLGDELTFANSSNQETCPGLASACNYYLIAWQDSSLDNDIKSRMLYLDGTPAGSVRNIASGTGEQLRPAMTSMNSKVIVAYEDQGTSPYTIGRYLFDESPPPKADWIIIKNNATGDDEVTTPYQQMVIPVDAVVTVYDGNVSLGSEAAQFLVGDGYYPPHIYISGGFAPGVEGIYVTTTLEGNQESESMYINLPIPVMNEGTDYSVDTVDCGYGKIAYKVTAAQKAAMESATGKTIATIKAYSTTDIETTFAHLTDAEATGGVVVPVGDTGVAVAKDPGNYGYAIAAYDANNQVVAYHVSDTCKTVWSGLGVSPYPVNANPSFNQTFTLTATSAGTFRNTNLSSYVTLDGLFTGLTKGDVIWVDNTHITVQVSGNLSQTGYYGEICVAADAFENAPEPGGTVRQVAQVRVDPEVYP